jgi:hypothetical protein
MPTFDKAILSWTDTINAGYNICAGPDEVELAFNTLKEYRDAQDEPNDIPYIETFFHGLGKMPGGKPNWRTCLDTVDREMLAELVEHSRIKVCG